MPGIPVALYALVANPPRGGRELCCWLPIPAALCGSMVLATVLAAVAESGGPDISSTCSRFVSVNSSFDGVIFAGGSVDVTSEAGGVFGISEVSSIGGGGRPTMSVAAGIDVAATGGSTGAS